MSKQIIIAEQYRIAAVFSEEQIQELIVAKGSHQVSDIYYGIVENVLPGIDAAFVNIGDTERNGFIHVSDLGPLRLKKSMGAITELLAPQQKVLVQVMKEPTGSKGPRLTGNISLPGRYLVLMPFGRGVNLSRRIRNESERNRLRALAILVKPAGMGIVIRTEAEGMAEEAIIEDLELLQKQWESILTEASNTRAPALLNRDDDFIQRVLRDTFNADVNRIVVDAQHGLKRVKQHLTSWSSGRLPQGVLVDHHKESIPILEYFRVNAAIREALKPRVDLPSGGYIIIQPTEALTVIDVNSGSFTRSATARETVLWTNYEAATEIARQLRLRNVAGVIIVDFIDMESRRDQLQLLEHFNKALRADKSRPQIAQLTELGLVELTRKRQGQNVYELFGRPCPTCSGLGHLVCLPGQDLNLESLPTASALAEEGLAGIGEFPLDGSVNISQAISGVRGRGRASNAREGRDSRRSPSGPPPRSGRWPGRSEGVPSFPNIENDPLDTELINHPSYQERGNRRRRRRPPGNELGRSPAPPLREVPREESPPDMSWDWQDPGVGHITENFAASTPTSDAPAAKKGRSERRSSRRGGNSSATEGRPEGNLVKLQPKEIITVEMTEDEQDVYAWMGVSPSVLTTQEIKNPRNVILAVTLPGQEPDLSHLGESDYRMRGKESLELAAESDTDEPREWDGDDMPSWAPNGNPSPKLASEPSLADLPAQSNQPDSSLDQPSEDAGAEVADDSSSRRRRRRSSASTDS
jgi:ribonuclease E